MQNPKPPRLTVDEVFDLITLFIAGRGTCDRLRTSTTIRDENNILIGAGYNGAISGSPHCDDIGHLIVDGHCLRSNHGEENALLNCLDVTRIKNGVATIISSPCFPCARKIISKNIKKLRYIGAYENAFGGELVKNLCEEKKVELEFISPEEIIKTLQKALDFLQGPGGLFKNLPKIKVL